MYLTSKKDTIKLRTSFLKSVKNARYSPSLRNKQEPLVGRIRNRASNLSDVRKNLLLFFDQPKEPCFLSKGKDKIAFRLPAHFHTKYYKDILKVDESAVAGLGAPGQTVFGAREVGYIVKVKDIELPDLSLPMQLPRDAHFSVFMQEHRDMAKRLIEVFMSMPNCQELLSICAYCQLHINPFLFIYCLSIAILHRPDTKGMDIPTFAETFPEMFIDRETIRRAREISFILPARKEPTIIDIDVRPPKIPEHKVAYFREDIGINSHHWHWHLIYPTKCNGIMNKDRRGELFYYMHHQIIARYNVERMCNGLNRVVPFKDFRERIADGCFPILDSSNASRAWPLRFDNVKLQDLNRPGPDGSLKITDLETWRYRIMSAIHTKSVLSAETDSYIPLDEETGIDLLGNLIEASDLSVNKRYYGDLHNQGHNFIAFVHDPNAHHYEPFSLMGATATAMRDPIFYRWHGYLDEVFIDFKDRLPQYSREKLLFPEITVSSINTVDQYGQDTNSNFYTMWERSVMNVRNGLDFMIKTENMRDLFVRVTYLQHEEFTYVIEVNNDTQTQQVGTVRIFLAPKEDEKGRQLNFNDQRKLMIEMDKFSQTLKPGKNIIRRSSKESSVTVPYERIFGKELDKSGSEATRKSYYCDCGWPQHMLLPKGNEQGYPVVLFVMVSNWKEDRADQEITGALKDNASYCGVRDHKYPDRRAMGFPFDRRASAATLRDFLQPNMAIMNCNIKFTDVIVDRNGIKSHQ